MCECVCVCVCVCVSVCLCVCVSPERQPSNLYAPDRSDTFIWVRQGPERDCRPPPPHPLQAARSTGEGALGVRIRGLGGLGDECAPHAAEGQQGSPFWGLQGEGLGAGGEGALLKTYFQGLLVTWAPFTTSSHLAGPCPAFRSRSIWFTWPGCSWMM